MCARAGRGEWGRAGLLHSSLHAPALRSPRLQHLRPVAWHAQPQHAPPQPYPSLVPCARSRATAGSPCGRRKQRRAQQCETVLSRPAAETDAGAGAGMFCPHPCPSILQQARQQQQQQRWRRRPAQRRQQRRPHARTARTPHLRRQLSRGCGQMERATTKNDTEGPPAPCTRLGRSAACSWHRAPGRGGPTTPRSRARLHAMEHAVGSSRGKVTQSICTYRRCASASRPGGAGGGCPAYEGPLHHHPRWHVPSPADVSADRTPSGSLQHPCLPPPPAATCDNSGLPCTHALTLHRPQLTRINLLCSTHNHGCVLAAAAAAAAAAGAVQGGRHEDGRAARLGQLPQIFRLLVR